MLSFLTGLFRFPASRARQAPASINGPRHAGWYAQRADDCERAIQRDFLRETVNVTTPYVDLDRVVTSIADEAKRAGWSERELIDAVLRLAKRHRQNV